PRLEQDPVDRRDRAAGIGRPGPFGARRRLRPWVARRHREPARAAVLTRPLSVSGGGPAGAAAGASAAGGARAKVTLPPPSLTPLMFTTPLTMTSKGTPGGRGAARSTTILRPGRVRPRLPGPGTGPASRGGPRGAGGSAAISAAASESVAARVSGAAAEAPGATAESPSAARASESSRVSESTMASVHAA